MQAVFLSALPGMRLYIYSKFGYNDINKNDVINLQKVKMVKGRKLYGLRPDEQEYTCC